MEVFYCVNFYVNVEELYVFLVVQPVILKGLVLYLEDITINARLIRIYTACGLNANISNRFYFESLNFINYYVSRNLILQELTSIYNLISDASSIHVNILKLVGTGYKCIVPRRYNFKKLLFACGFCCFRTYLFK